MDTKTLQTLSKDELIRIIENLQLKDALQSKGVCFPKVDYQYLVEGASDAIFVLDDQGNLVFLNSAWEHIFPVNKEEAMGMHFSAAVPAIEIERATAVFKSVIGGNEIRNEKFKTFNRDGSAMYVIANLSPIRSDEGKIVGLLGILRNITDIHLMERKLKVNSKRLEEKIKEQIEQAEELRRLTALNEDIITNAPIGIITMDPTGIILSENPAIKQIMGLDPGQSVVGMNFIDLGGIAQTGFQRVLDEVFIQKKPQAVKNAVYRRSPAPEDERALNLKINPILDGERRVKTVMLMVEDVTEQSRIGKRMQRAEQLSAMGLLAAGVAYELKVPINLLAIDLNFIENNIPENSPMRDYVRSMKEELTRIKQISEQLLNLSKPEETDKEVFEAHKLITSHPIQIMLNRLQKNGFSVVTEYPDAGVKVRGIRNQMVQVLLHLIANAEEAMPDKGELKITVDSMMNNGALYAAITVSDTGLGIPREHLKKVFQPFFTTKGEKSTGLGLMVSYSIVENHGGTIAIKSKPGEGTSIMIVLPGVVE